MRWLAAAAGLVLVVAAQVPAQGNPPAQTLPAPDVQTPVLTSPVLTLDQDRFYLESAFGQAASARTKADESALLAENQSIFAALEAEEKDLTARRAALAPDEFTQLANAFDAKAENIRAAQDAKGADIARQRNDDQRRFFDAALPVLAEVMAEMGAVAILDKQAIILSFEKIDMTDAAIARVDAVLGDGGAVPQKPAVSP